MGHATLERVRLFGPRSADYIRASGHSGCIATEVVLQAKQAEYMTAKMPSPKLGGGHAAAGVRHFPLKKSEQRRDRFRQLRERLQDPLLTALTALRCFG